MRALLNILWLVLLVGGLGYGCANGACASATGNMFEQATAALKLAIDLAAIVAFWFGVSRLAEKSGMLDLIGGLFRPIVRLFFREIPKDHPALGLVTMNVAANVLGLGNAATPFGLRAMQAFKDGSGAGEVATPAMVTFLVLNSATVNLIPAGMIALRAATGSHDPAAPYLASVLTTSAAAVVALSVNAVLGRRMRQSP